MCTSMHQCIAMDVIQGHTLSCCISAYLNAYRQLLTEPDSRLAAKHYSHTFSTPYHAKVIRTVCHTQIFELVMEIRTLVLMLP